MMEIRYKGKKYIGKNPLPRNFSKATFAIELNTLCGIKIQPIFTSKKGIDIKKGITLVLECYSNHTVCTFDYYLQYMGLYQTHGSKKRSFIVKITLLQNMASLPHTSYSDLYYTGCQTNYSCCQLLILIESMIQYIKLYELPQDIPL